MPVSTYTSTRGQRHAWRRLAAMVLTLVASVSMLAVPAGAASAGSGTQYLVRRGDTLSDVALRFGTTVHTLASANGVADANRIYAGSYLTIPAGSGSGGNGGAGTYVVRTGDTLSSIAQRYGVSVSALANANGLADPDLVYAGRTITIPGGSGTVSASSVSTGVIAGGITGLPSRLRNDPARYNLYHPMFQHWAAHYGVPLDLIEGLCWLESGWQPSVVSSTGAIGMCQFMPGTTTFVSGMIGVAMNPWNADNNIRLSARYLRYLLDRAGGNVRTAVASYYQGFDSVTTRGMYNDTVAYVEGVLAFRQRF